MRLDSLDATRTERVNLFLHYALEGARKGEREVFPVAPGRKAPPIYSGWNSPDPAHPNRATRNPRTIRGWWRDHPGANIATCLRENEFAIELEHGHDEEAWWLFWRDAPGGLPRTLRHRTASDRPRIYLRFPPGQAPLPRSTRPPFPLNRKT